jgi:predicted GNAT family acetyltransferase
MAAEDRLIREWMNGFVHEIGMPNPANEIADRLLTGHRMYVWKDNVPRCMVAADRDTPNGVCINAVYTPPDYRRKGYATAAVAALSKQLLAGGKHFCCLYTDSENPTSNAIYRRVGYEPIREDVDIAFLDR